MLNRRLNMLKKYLDVKSGRLSSMFIIESLMQDPQRGQPHGVTVGAQSGHHHRGVRGDSCRGCSVVYSQRVVLFNIA